MSSNWTLISNWIHNIHLYHCFPCCSIRTRVIFNIKRIVLFSSISLLIKMKTWSLWSRTMPSTLFLWLSTNNLRSPFNTFKIVLLSFSACLIMTNSFLISRSIQSYWRSCLPWVRSIHLSWIVLILMKTTLQFFLILLLIVYCFFLFLFLPSYLL